jgi:hypothetical protein
MRDEYDWEAIEDAMVDKLCDRVMVMEERRMTKRGKPPIYPLLCLKIDGPSVVALFAHLVMVLHQAG